MNGRGQQVRQVTVNEVVPKRGLAICSEATTSRKFDVPLRPMRGRSGPPRVGEVWIIDTTLGTWSFAALMVSVPPAVTGSRASADEVTLSLLEALAELGLVKDETV